MSKRLVPMWCVPKMVLAVPALPMSFASAEGPNVDHVRTS